MSAQKRASVRRPTTKKTHKKTARKATTKRVSKTSPKKVVKKITKKVAKKTSKKSSSKTTKTAPKATRKVRRSALAQSVREARYGGHQDTLPKNPKAPGRILGRSFTLGALGAAHMPLNTDALAVGLARIGGVAVMLAGVTLSWQLYNQLAFVPVATQTASVTESIAAPELTVSVTSETPLQDTVPLVVAAPAAQDVVLLLKNANETQVLGAATQRTAGTWELLFDTTTVPDGSYELHALALQAGTYTATTAAEAFVIANATPTTTPAASATAAVSSSTTQMEVAASSSATSSAPVSVSKTLEAVASTSMPLLLAPIVHTLAPMSDGSTVVVGEGAPAQLVELLLLRDQQRATTTVQTNGWWSLEIATPKRGDTYELYAQAGPDALSQPLDFTVISGRLVQPTTGQTQTTATANSEPARDMLLWYLVAAIATVAIGAVILLLGHHLHHTGRRRESAQPTALDQAA